MPRCRLPRAFSGLKIAPSGGVGGGYGLSGSGELASDGRLPAAFLASATASATFSAAAVAALLRGIHHGGGCSLTRGSDHTVLMPSTSLLIVSPLSCLDSTVAAVSGASSSCKFNNFMPYSGVDIDGLAIQVTRAHQKR